MRASRTPTGRLIDFSAPLKFDGQAALRKQIAQFVAGVRGARKTPVSEEQIVTWFRSTPPEFVKARLAEIVGVDVRIVGRSLGSFRRANGSYGYETIKHAGN